MNRYILITILSVFLIGCADRFEENGVSPSGDGNVQITISTSDMPEIVTRASSDADVKTIESVVLFAFTNDGKLVKKMFQYFDGDNATLSMYLTNGDYKLCAVCNLSDPEQVYNIVNSYSDLGNQYVSIQNAEDAFRGKFVMYKEQSVNIDAGTTTTDIQVERLASFHDFTIKFTPVNTSEKFEITEVKMNNIPKGSWIVPKADNESYVDANKGDWTYREQVNDMAARYFTSDRMELEELEKIEADEDNTQWKYSATYALFENRRGGLPVSGSHPYEYNDSYWNGSQALATSALGGNNGDAELLEALRQFYKKHWADYEMDGVNKKFANATYMTISGIYVMSNNETFKVTYYVYLGEDNFKDYNVKRNTKYTTTVNIRSMNTIDTRIEEEPLGEITLSASDEVLDAHCNTVKAVLYSPGAWEVWVENPDKTPWLEISGSQLYRGRQIGGNPDQERYATYKMTGDMRTLRNIYIHTDEYIPDLKDPMKNNAQAVRSGRIAFRRVGYTDIKYLTVRQYPAQLAVLHIKYDVHTMKEVRDTFYIERILEKKHMSWGFEKYWSFITDDLIASGRWDGLSNTRKLYQVAVDGDKWGVKPAYPSDKYPNGIPENEALGYMLGKNRDRDGDEKVGYDEIMWYIPALKELELLYDALNDGYLNFESNDDIFHCSTPSSADPDGVTVGFSYYVKMNNGKYGIGQRDRKYNVIGLRRRNNEWSGPDAGNTNFTVTVETGWTDEELVMPKY